MHYIRTYFRAPLTASICAMLLTVGVTCPTFAQTGSTVGITTDQIKVIQDQAESDLAALLAKIQSAKTTEAEAQTLIQQQAEKLGLLQQQLRETSTKSNIADTASKKLIAEMEAINAAKIQTLITTHAADLANLQTALRTETTIATNQQIVELEKTHEDKVKSMTQVYTSKLIQLQNDLIDKTTELTKLTVASKKPSAKLLQEIETTKKLKQKLSNLQAEAQKNASEQTAKFDLLNTQLTTLRSQLQTETENRLATAKKLNQALVDIDNLNKDFNQSTTTTADQHRGELEDLRSMVSDLKTQLSDSKDASTQLQSDLAAKSQAYDEALLQIGELKGTLNNLDAKVATAKETIDALTKRLERSMMIRKRLVAQLKEARAKAASVSAQPAVPLLQAMDTDLMFASGSARLSKAGRKHIADLIPDLQAKLGDLPEDMDWTLVVEGHADTTPIRYSRFKSNLALSMARSLAVVRELTLKSKIEPKRLMAAGLGEHRPLNTGTKPEDLAANRRVELHLVQR